MGVVLEKLGSGRVGRGELGMIAGDDQSAHHQTDADPEQSGDGVAADGDQRDPAVVPEPLDHHRLGHDVRLAGRPDGKHEEPGEASDHAHRAPRAHRLGIVPHQDGRGRGGTAFEDRQRAEKDQHAGDHHDHALDDVGVDGSDDAAGDTVEDEHRAREHDAGDQAGSGEPFGRGQDALEHRTHR